MKKNYKKGDKVIVYGYSYGGDNAVNLTEAIGHIPVDLLVIVDSSDGVLLKGLTVDTSIPNNVKIAYNFYQTETSGNSSRFLPLDSDNDSSSENNSFDGFSDAPGSRGFPHSSEGKAKVFNIRIVGEDVEHDNIQTEAKKNIMDKIKQGIDQLSIEQ